MLPDKLSVSSCSTVENIVLETVPMRLLLRSRYSRAAKVEKTLKINTVSYNEK